MLREHAYRAGKLRLESSVAVSEHDGHVVIESVGDGDVEVAVAIEVTGHGGTRKHDSDGPRRLTAEGAIAIAQQHGDVAVTAVHDGQVHTAVAIEVTGD